MTKQRMKMTRDGKIAMIIIEVMINKNIFICYLSPVDFAGYKLMEFTTNSMKGVKTDGNHSERTSYGSH
jgi:hypothetical protein